MKFDLKPTVIWITGLSGAGKTTVAKNLQQRLLHKGNIRAILLDGDEMRAALALKSNFSKEDRLGLAYAYARLAKLLYDQGFVVIVATISMFEEVRQWNRTHIKGYIETYLKISEEERMKRDPKKLYATAQEMVSTDSMYYEEPVCPDLTFEDKQRLSADEIAAEITNYYSNF